MNICIFKKIIILLIFCFPPVAALSADAEAYRTAYIDFISARCALTQKTAAALEKCATDHEYAEAIYELAKSYAGLDSLRQRLLTEFKDMNPDYELEASAEKYTEAYNKADGIVSSKINGAIKKYGEKSETMQAILRLNKTLNPER